MVLLGAGLAGVAAEIRRRDVIDDKKLMMIGAQGRYWKR